MIAKLKKHAIVFGYDHLGRYVTDKLDELGFDHVIITKDPIIYNQLLKNDMFAVLEYETQPITALKSAGIERASMIIVAHQDDSEKHVESS